MYLIPFTHEAPKDTIYPELQKTSHARWPECIRTWAYGRDLRSLGNEKEIFFQYDSNWLIEGFDQNALPYWRLDSTGEGSYRSLLEKIHNTIWDGMVKKKWCHVMVSRRHNTG
jgi:hypothetical protein